MAAAATPSLEIRLTRVDRTYRLGDTVAGVLNVCLGGLSGSVAHNGLVLRAQGQVRPQGGDGAAAGVRTVSLMDQRIVMLPKGSLPGGGTIQLPFELTLEPLPGRALAETYHGVYVSVRYWISAELARSGFMAPRPLEAELEFVAEVPEAQRRAAEPIEFSISPESMKNVKRDKVGQLSRFLVTGRINRTNCSLDAPFTGEVTVVESEKPVKSIDLQLVRVESLGAGEGKLTEATEIQNLQVGAGDVCRNMPIPLFMVFPRVFTAPSVETDAYKVAFEINVNVMFEGDPPFSAISNFPVSLYRYRAAGSTTM